jgi:Fic family protein
MALSIAEITPFIPSDRVLGTSRLPDKAVELSKLSARLAGKLAPATLTTLERYMRVINSYYSNLIEGNATQPYEIRAAQRGDYSDDPGKRDLQLESLAHLQVQGWLRDEQPDIETLFSPEFIQAIHQRFYQQMPENLWAIKDTHGNILEMVIPGTWRSKGVKVGAHIPPVAKNLESLMINFCNAYKSDLYRGDRRLIAIMAAHHRFVWIHPFADGNGRVGRLLTDAALKAIGLDSYGAWCLSRGLARSSTRYKGLLANADMPRQGSYDGRGALTEKNLLAFCDYMLDTATDQVGYISELLNLSGLRTRINSYVQARNDSRVVGITKELKPITALILHTAFIHGEIERDQALELCAMPGRSARRLLSQLKSDGLLSETSSKSPLRWEIPEHAEPWYFPELAPSA